MDKKSKQEQLVEKQIKELTDSPNVRRLIDLNLLDPADMVAEYHKQMGLVLKFKSDLIDEDTLRELVGCHDFPGTSEQQMAFLVLMMNCMSTLDEFDKAMGQYLPVIGLISSLLKKMAELKELKQAITT